MFEHIGNLLFPAQCGGCDRFGNGLCDVCLPPRRDYEVRTPTLSVKTLGSYEGPLRRAVLALKDGRRDVAAAMGTRLAAVVTNGAHLVPVPTTRTRRAVRGFDGAELLAATAARIAGAHVSAVLCQIAGDTQRGRTRFARLAARGRFSCKRKFAGTQVLLVDDVMTTGTTLEDCAATLRAAGAIVQQAIVIAVSDRR